MSVYAFNNNMLNDSDIFVIRYFQLNKQCHDLIYEWYQYVQSHDNMTEEYQDKLIKYINKLAFICIGTNFKNMKQLIKFCQNDSIFYV